MHRIILLINCPDKKGIIAHITNFINDKKGNIVYIDQYVDRLNETFYMRVEIEVDISNNYFNDFKKEFDKTLGHKFKLNCEFYLKEEKPKMAVFVSKYDHCLYDILSQHKSNNLNCTIPFIISNHIDLELVAKRFEIPYYHIPIEKGNKEKAEEIHIKILKKNKVDFIVLARYMQILSPKLVDLYKNKIINIHHSFLPAFPGAKPYHSAFKRGVKIIGATSHYVTDELDGGPIIEQDTVRVSHINSVNDFISKGEDLERIVLIRALKLHTDRKVMIDNNKTIIFN